MRSRKEICWLLLDISHPTGDAFRRRLSLPSGHHPSSLNLRIRRVVVGHVRQRRILLTLHVLQKRAYVHARQRGKPGGLAQVQGQVPGQGC